MLSIIFVAFPISFRSVAIRLALFSALSEVGERRPAPSTETSVDVFQTYIIISSVSQTLVHEHGQSNEYQILLRCKIPL